MVGTVSEPLSAVQRGGNWGNGANAGALSVNLNNAPSHTNSNIGFRCPPSYIEPLVWCSSRLSLRQARAGELVYSALGTKPDGGRTSVSDLPNQEIWRRKIRKVPGASQ